jgi:hypothetical protein
LEARQVRFGGLAAALGGLLWGAAALLRLAGAPPVVSDALYLAATVALLAGVFGFYVMYAQGMGGVGQAGFIQSLIGLGMLGAGLVLEFFSEAARQITSFGFLIVALGFVLVGYSALYNEPLPRWNFLPLVVAAFIPLDILFGGLAPAVSSALSVGFGASWVVLGYLLWLEPEDRPPGRKR